MSCHPPIRFALILCLLAAGITQQMIKSNNYPLARKSDQIDDYHGVKVADPYRWLEDLDSEETRNWVEAENKLSFGYLASISVRNGLKVGLPSSGTTRNTAFRSEKGTAISTPATAVFRTSLCFTP